MLRTLLLIGFITLALHGATPAAHAEDAAPPEAQTKLDQETQELMKGLDENKLRQLAAIRNAHGTLKAVDNVQTSVKNAVGACSEKNPGLKDEINSRFDNWKMAIRPTIKKGEDKLEKMILLQSFAKPSEVRAYLKLFDDAVKARDAKITAVPVTEEAECKRLIKKMDETEETLVKLLTESLQLDQPIIQKEL